MYCSILYKGKAMKNIILSIITITTLFSCSLSVDGEQGGDSHSEYTFEVDGWENLGKQTLVKMNSTNPAAMNQDILFTVDVINTSGEHFIKDTSVHFDEKDQKKSFQLVLYTEGEIEKVKLFPKEV